MESSAGGDERFLDEARRFLAGISEPTENPLLSGLSNALDLVADSEDWRLEPGCIVADRFEIRDTLGVGGMGAVYRAFDSTLERDVALKVIRAGSSSARDSGARFRREILTARKVAHPNLISIYDVGRYTDEEGRETPFFVMELIAGPTLAKALAGGRALEPAVGLTIVSEILAGLEALHKAGIVHRDLKPSNVLLEGVVESPSRVVLSDFGLAVSTRPDAKGEGSITRAGAVIGTPTYMAPEQFLGRKVSPATDLYALALIAFEMLAGRALFDPESEISASPRRFSAPPSLMAESERVPPSWRRALGRALEPDPADRPQSAPEFRRVIERELGRPLWSRRAALGAAGAAACFGAVAWIASRPPPAAPSGPAWEAYQRGRYLWARRNGTPLNDAEAEFRRALDLDPEFGLAYSGLADCHSIRADYAQGTSGREIAAALEAAETAVRLAPDRAEPYASLGLARDLDPWSEQDPEAAFQAALDIDPAYAPALQWQGAHLARSGRFDEGLESLLQARSLNPALIQVDTQLAWHYYFTGRIGQAYEAVERMLTLEPDYGPAHGVTILCLIEEGRLDEAVARTERLGPVRELPNVTALVGYVWAVCGQPESAEAALRSLEEERRREPHRWSFQIAGLRAALGDAPAAADQLEIAFREREVALNYISMWPYFDRMVSHSTLVDLRNRLGLAVAPRLLRPSPPA